MTARQLQPITFTGGAEVTGHPSMLGGESAPSFADYVRKEAPDATFTDEQLAHRRRVQGEDAASPAAEPVAAADFDPPSSDIPDL
jgi:hypothetical protein